MGVIAAVVLSALGGAASGSVENIPEFSGGGGGAPQRAPSQPINVNDVKSTFEGIQNIGKQPTNVSGGGGGTIDSLSKEQAISQPKRKPAVNFPNTTIT